MALGSKVAFGQIGPIPVDRLRTGAQGRHQLLIRERNKVNTGVELSLKANYLGAMFGCLIATGIEPDVTQSGWPLCVLASPSRCFSS